ncbi:MAG: Uma2 family endonuclease [Gemmataceae bacterium]|nr:Uma2 family endonuclease [Gemmataceae bacterium]
MNVLVTDPELACRIIQARAKTDGDRWTEVWNGVTVVPALPNNDHQRLVMDLCYAGRGVTDPAAGDQVLPGANVSNYAKGWRKRNYRCPDVVVYLAGNPAVDHGAHWQGGPDLAVEIQSPGEKPRRKLRFYAEVGTRELLVIDRDPWALELYQLVGGKLVSVGRSDLANPAVLASTVLPLTFRLRDARPRPVIDIAHPATGQAWTA